MIAAVEAAWLFIRGSESVRIVRTATRSGALHLHIQGPGSHAESRTFSDVVECMQQQAELERRLVSQGFVLEHFTSDRRKMPGRTPRLPRDRRR